MGPLGTHQAPPWALRAFSGRSHLCLAPRAATGRCCWRPRVGAPQREGGGLRCLGRRVHRRVRLAVGRRPDQGGPLAAACERTMERLCLEPRVAARVRL
eukprot:2266955-Alexandrium_andersonii.AAC.1